MAIEQSGNRAGSAWPLSLRLSLAWTPNSTFARQALLSYKGLFLWLNWPAYVSNVFLRPGLIVAMFALMGQFARGDGAAEAYVIGLTAYSVPSIVMGGVLQSFYYERAFGTLSYLFASPAPRASTFFARGMLHLPNALLAVGAALLLSALLLPIDTARADWGAMTLCFCVMAASCTACALCWGSLCIFFRDWQSFYSLAITVFLVFTGAIIPRDSLPPVAHEFGALLPTTFGIEGLRDAFEGAGVTTIGRKLALEALVGAAYAAGGLWGFRALEAHARRSGAYEAV
jgi:ABC-type polysaccharide/polyol phosphate export permease